MDVASPLLGTLGDYGGPTATIPLLPGSPAIGMGDLAQAGTTDQRGYTRGSSVDIGAFQDQGFVLTPVAGSTPQTATVATAFANPLAVTVTANNTTQFTNPVAGGVVTYTGPNSGARHRSPTPVRPRSVPTARPASRPRPTRSPAATP